MTDRVLSSDVAAQWPTFELKTKVTRTHKETLVHPWFRWIKREIEVIDHVKFVGIVVTQGNVSWEIPLSPSDTDESKQTNSGTEVSTPSN